MKNKKLSEAKNVKNDEFYTQLADIEKEVQAYLEFNPDVFKGKTILCPCDDPYESNFFKFFALRFREFKLKKLIATCYAGSPMSSAIPATPMFNNGQLSSRVRRTVRIFWRRPYPGWPLPKAGKRTPTWRRIDSMTTSKS